VKKTWHQNSSISQLTGDHVHSVFSSAIKNLKIRTYKTIVLPVVLYWSETSFLTFREEHRLRVFGNRVLRRVFGPKSDVVIGERRKLLNKELHDLYSSPSIIRMIKSRKMRRAGHVARMVEKRKAYKWWESQRERDH
jgi:hypothetical protein